MHILFDTHIQFNANLEKVWESLVSAKQKEIWQSGVERAQLLSGSEGYRGAKIELTLSQSGEKVIEQLQRSRPFERLQTQFQLGDSCYQQIIHLSRMDDESTQLTYHCKQILNSGWRRAFNIRPAVPTCVQPEIFDSLSRHITASSSTV